MRVLGPNTHVQELRVPIEEKKGLAKTIAVVLTASGLTALGFSFDANNTEQKFDKSTQIKEQQQVAALHHALSKPEILKNRLPCLEWADSQEGRSWLNERKIVAPINLLQGVEKQDPAILNFVVEQMEALNNGSLSSGELGTLNLTTLHRIQKLEDYFSKSTTEVQKLVTDYLNPSSEEEKIRPPHEKTSEVLNQYPLFGSESPSLQIAKHAKYKYIDWATLLTDLTTLERNIHKSSIQSKPEDSDRAPYVATLHAF